MRLAGTDVGRRGVFRAVCAGLAVGFLVWGPAVNAESLAATNVTLAEAVDLAVRDNAELRSLRARQEAMQERLAQAGTLPNPMFTYSGMDMASGGAWPDTGEKYYMVQQEFPSVGKRALREEMAAKDVEAMRQDLESMTRDVVMRAKETCYDLYAAQRVLAITREEAEVLRHIEQIATAMYAAGERSQTDVLKAQAERTMLKQKILEAQAQEATLKAKLNTLLNRRVDGPLGEVLVPPEPAIAGNLEDGIARAAANRPEVKAAQAQVERYELEKRLMAKETVPDYKVGLEYRDIGASEDMIMVSVSVDLPVWRSKYHAGVREAERMRDASLAAREAAERQSAFEVQDASFKLRAARSTLELYRNELMPQARARLSASEAGYRTGKVDFMDFLESERFLLDARIMIAMAEGAVGMQAVRLERALGVDVEGGTADTKSK